MKSKMVVWTLTCAVVACGFLAWLFDGIDRALFYLEELVSPSIIDWSWGVEG